MTETSPVATTGRIKSTLLDASEDELADLRAAQGLAIPLVDLRIVEPGTDDELPWDGEARGELQARGPWIAAGYYNDERSADSFTDDGWLRTGDVATISPNGYVRLVDRTKDLVKSGGEWISSVELENAIMAHPKVAEAAVIGIPDEKWSERPLACVVPDGDEEISPRRAARSSSPSACRSGGSRTTSRSSTRSRRPRSASSPRRRCASSSRSARRLPEGRVDSGVPALASALVMFKVSGALVAGCAATDRRRARRAPPI